MVPSRGIQTTTHRHWVARHGAGVTLAGFLGACLVLGLLPLPEWAQPVDLSTPAAREAAWNSLARPSRRTPPAWDAVPRRAPVTPAEAPGRSAPVAVLPLDLPGDGAGVTVAAGDPTGGATVEAAAGVHAATPTAPARELGEPSPSECALRQRAREADAPGAPLENPCVRPAPWGCAATALEAWFSALDAVRARQPGSRAAAIVFGNSLISSDMVTDVVRDRLVARFGASGPGLLLPERQSELGSRSRTGEASGDWAPRGITSAGGTGELPLGMTGLAQVAQAPGARLGFTVSGPSTGWMMLQLPARARARVELDGRLLRRVDAPGAVPVDIPAGSHVLECVAESAGVAVQGTWLERPAPGVSLSPVGVLSAGAPAFLKADEALFREQLSLVDPALVVVMLGGAEVRRFSAEPPALPALRASLREFLERNRRAAPRASCLVVGPLDAVRGGTADEEGLQTLTRMGPFLSAWREEALEAGCAWFDLFSAMGGEGSFARFHERGWMNADLVHPDGAGAQVLGQLLADALLESWRDTPVPPPPRRNPLDSPPPHPLSRALSALRGAQSACGAGFRVGLASLGSGGDAAPALASPLEDALALSLSRRPGPSGAWECVAPESAGVEPVCLGAALAEGEPPECAVQGHFDLRGHDLWVVGPVAPAGPSRWLGEELRRLRASEPGADCLVVTPWEEVGEQSQPGRTTRVVTEAALAQGCAVAAPEALAAGGTTPPALGRGLVDALLQAAEQAGR